MGRFTPGRDRGFSSGHSSGFTIVELLVVIGIISVLMSVLLPALGRARESAKRSACLSQLREISHGVQMYLVESRGVLPAFGANYGATGTVNFADDEIYRQFPSAIGSLTPFIKDRRIFICPSADADRIDPASGAAPTPTSDTNYVANGVLAGQKVSRIRNPTELIYLQEWLFRSSVCWYRPVNSNTADPLKPYTWWHSNDKNIPQYNNSHNRGGNLLFLDGHAEWRECKSLRAADFGLAGGPGYSGNPTDNCTTDYLLTYRSTIR